MIKSTNFSPKILPIAGYYLHFLTQFDKFSLFFLSPYSYAKVSIKYFLFILLTVAFGNGVAADYLKIKSYPEFHSPKNGVGRFIEMNIKPKSKQDVQFEIIFKETQQLVLIPNHDQVLFHEASMDLEISHDGKTLSTHYSSSKAKSNAVLKKHWQIIFKALREITNEHYHF